MGIVNMLKFDKYSGAMISDEEYLDIRWRRCYYLDSIHSLLSPSTSNTLGMEAIYGGVGNPSFHYEAVNKIIKKTDKLLSGNKKIETGIDLGNIALDTIHEIINRRVDDILNLFYGFTRDDFNQGYTEINNKKIDIKQDSIKEDARKLISFKDKKEFLKPIFENKIAIMTYDKEHGFNAFCIKCENGVLSMVSGGFESLGKGIYGSGRTFGKYFKERYLTQRREGMDRVEGICLLISSAIEARSYYSGIGGYFNLAYMNGEKSTHEDRYKEIYHHRAKLATEIVTGLLNHEIKRDKTYELLNDLIFEDQPVEEVEEKMWKAAKSHKRLELLLRGYKDVALK